VLNSPARLGLHEDEGVTLALADVETEVGPLAEPKEARALDQAGDPLEPEVWLEGNQERAMVLASRPSASASWSVGEWVWPDPRKLGEVWFILHDLQEKELWGHLEQSGVSAGKNLTVAEARLVEILKKIRLARQSASVNQPNFARVSPHCFPLRLSHR
jgi:hypothetical protein